MMQPLTIRVPDRRWRAMFGDGCTVDIISAYDNSDTRRQVSEAHVTHCGRRWPKGDKEAQAERAEQLAIKAVVYLQEQEPSLCSDEVGTE